MYTHSLCRGQIIDAVPAHLQQQKRYKQADQCLAMCRGTPQTEMDICQIGNKMVWLPSSQGVGATVMKNWEPLVPLPMRLPALAMASR